MPDLKGKLSVKQDRFIDEYMIDGNAAQAAIKAGYSKKCAATIGKENIRKPQIKAEIEKRQGKLRDKLEITQEKVLKEIAGVAYLNNKGIWKKATVGDKVRALDMLSKHLGLYNLTPEEVKDTTPKSTIAEMIELTKVLKGE